MIEVLGAGWPEHFGSDPGDKSTGHETLTVGAKVISQTGNDIAFSGGECRKTGSGDFLCRFLSASCARRVPGDFVKLGRSRARTQGADPNSVRLHFLGEPLCKE